MRPFRFGIHLTWADDRVSWTRLGKQAEDLGFDIITMPDHFVDNIPQLAPVPALASIAEVTQNIRIGTWVFSNDYRHPVMLAKEAATVDVLSNGRFELGLGAGWLQDEYQAAAISFENASVRIQRLEESVQVITSLWCDDVTDFDGEHYAIRGLRSLPKPVQKPRPPVAIGGGGQRILSLAGRAADIVGINFNLSSSQHADEAMSMPETRRKVEFVRAAAGKRFESLELQVRVLYFTTAPEQLEETAQRAAQRFDVSREKVVQSPHVLIGPRDALVEEIQRRREETGISYLTFSQEHMELAAPIIDSLSGN